MKRRLDRLRDAVVRTHTPSWRLAVAHYPRTLEEALRRHSVPDASALTLSAAIGASLLTMDGGWSWCVSFAHPFTPGAAKGDERCVVTMVERDPDREVYAEAMPRVGEVRAFVKDVALPPDTPPLTTVARVLYAAAKPVLSVVEGTGEQGVHNLFVRSSPMAVRLWRGGMMTLEETVTSATDVSTARARDMLERLPAWGADGPVHYVEDDVLPLLCGADAVLQRAAVDATARTLVAYHCRCSRAQFVAALPGLGRAAVLDMRAKGQRELVCHFCATPHVMREEDFDSVLRQFNNKS